ncbi:MAG: PKD domain-containing protein [Methylomicrobium sp.]
MLLLSTTRHAERLHLPLYNTPSGVRDGKPSSAPKGVFQLVSWLTVFAVALAASPLAEAANKKPKAQIVKVAPVSEGAAVTLNGGLSADPEGGALKYAWTQISGLPGIEVNGAETSTLTFKAPPIPKTNKKTKPAKLAFQLAVTDDQGLSAVKKTVLTVKPLNAPPVANAGANQSAGFTQTVTLTSLSNDPDAERGGQIIKYQWKQLKKPGDPKVKLINAKTPQASFASPAVPAQLEFQLTVTDNDNARVSDNVIVSVTEAALAASFSLDKKALKSSETATAGASGIKGGKGPYRVKFEWGDGSAAEEIPLGGETSKTLGHQYAKTGSFKQKVTVIDANGSEITSTEETVTVSGDQALDAALNVSSSAIVKGGQVTAQAASISGGAGPYTVAFNWGDGSANEQETLANGVTAKSANHTYATAGTYDLTITVTDNAGGSKTQPFQITVSDAQAPALGGTLSLTQAVVVFNTKVQAKVDITGGTAPYAVKFEWGDGQTSGPTPLNAGITSATGEHFYGLVGSYTITAIITDANGGTKTVTTNVTVNPVDAPLTECQSSGSN